MDPNRLTEKSQEAVRGAQALAARLSHQQIDNEHLLAALLEQENGVVPEVLLKADVDLESLHRRLMAELEKLPKVAVSQGAAAGMYATQRLERTLAEAEVEAKKRHDEFVSVEHLLLALFRGDGKAVELLREAGLTSEKLEQAVKEIRGNQRVTSQTPESTYRALEQYGRDLTKMAEEGKLDPVIGRDEEIRRRDSSAVAPDQEQPGADRRAGRRQDGHRRGAGAAHRARRRARGSRRTKGSCRSTWAR